MEITLNTVIIAVSA